MPVGFSLARNQFGVETTGDSRPCDITLKPEAKYLINPGSVGQPRDGDPRAGFAIVDAAKVTVTIAAHPLPVAKAQARIVERGLPEILAERWRLGAEGPSALAD